MTVDNCIENIFTPNDFYTISRPFLSIGADFFNQMVVIHRMKKTLKYAMWLSTENHAGLNNTNLNFSDFTISFQDVPE